MGDFRGRGACQWWTMGLKLLPSRLCPKIFFWKIHLRTNWGWKLKLDLFKACLSDTFLGFITFLSKVFILPSSGLGRLFQLLWKGQQENICFCWLSLFATFVWIFCRFSLQTFAIFVWIFVTICTFEPMYICLFVGNQENICFCWRSLFATFVLLFRQCRLSRGHSTKWDSGYFTLSNFIKLALFHFITITHIPRNNYLQT